MPEDHNQFNEVLLSQAAQRSLAAEVNLRDYFDTVVADLRRTMEHESHDREIVASALRGEHRSALGIAEQEREKAAAALRIELQRAMKDGDERLREHIEAAVVQLEAALLSAEKLEMERVAAVNSKIDSLRQMIAISDDAQKEAITKAEMANEKRFDSVNEFRGQQKDIIGQFASRTEVSGIIKGLEDTAASERRNLADRIDNLQQRADRDAGGVVANIASKSDRQFSAERFQAWLALGAFIVIGLLGLVLSGHIH